jgi:hypothetical protein
MAYLTVKSTDEKLSNNVIGLFRPDDHDEIIFYKEPSFSSEKIPKILVKKKNYNTIYKVEGIENLIHYTIGISGWQKYKDKVSKTTWIKLNPNGSIWAPFKYYLYSESEYEYESDFEEL